jgi:hypothetical protein
MVDWFSQCSVGVNDIKDKTIYPYMINGLKSKFENKNIEWISIKPIEVHMSKGNDLEMKDNDFWLGMAKNNKELTKILYYQFLNN